MAVTAQEVKGVPEGEIGPLALIGVTEPWQASLLLPTRYEDFLTVDEDGGDLDVARMTVLHGRITNNVGMQTNKNKASSRFVAVVSLFDGTCIEMTWFGDFKNVRRQIQPGMEV